VNQRRTKVVLYHISLLKLFLTTNRVISFLAVPPNPPVPQQQRQATPAQAPAPAPAIVATAGTSSGDKAAGGGGAATATDSSGEYAHYNSKLTIADFDLLKVN
jgi:hypothetical protein